jgi:hypothetical protein
MFNVKKRPKFGPMHILPITTHIFSGKTVRKTEAILIILS